MLRDAIASCLPSTRCRVCPTVKDAKKQPTLEKEPVDIAILDEMPVTSRPRSLEDNEQKVRNKGGCGDDLQAPGYF